MINETIFNLYKDRCHWLYNFYKTYSVLNSYHFFQDILSLKDFKKCHNFISSRSQKRKRCFDKYKIIEIYCALTNAKLVFGTITLNNEFLKLSYETQKKNIQRYLKKHYFYVIKNSDYGSRTDRLHYHFLGLTFDNMVDSGKISNKGRKMYNLVVNEKTKWKWGFEPNIEIIPYNYIDKKLISNYMVKLNNHSNKMSTKRTRLSILKNKEYLKKYNLHLSHILFD